MGRLSYDNLPIYLSDSWVKALQAFTIDLSSLQTACRSLSFMVLNLACRVSPSTRDMYMNIWPLSSTQPKTSGTGTRPCSRSRINTWASTSAIVTSAPYLTASPRDGTITGGGWFKDAARQWPEASFRALISAGEGSAGALRSWKKLDWGKTLAVGFGVEHALSSGVSFVAIEAEEWPVFLGTRCDAKLRFLEKGLWFSATVDRLAATMMTPQRPTCPRHLRLS